MCYPCSSPAAHRAWGTIPDGTSAALVAVRCLSVWPLGRQYFLLMGLEQGACVWHHQSLLILLKVNGYLPARVPARRASFPKGQQSPAVSFSTDAVCSMNRVCTVNRTHTIHRGSGTGSRRTTNHVSGTRPDTTTFLCWISALLVTFSCEMPIRFPGGSLWWQPDAASFYNPSLGAGTWIRGKSFLVYLRPVLYAIFTSWG